MRAPRLEPGLELDGFTLEARVKLGGMAELWRVRHPRHTTPLVMKIPLVLDGDDPTMIVGFEMEQMILPRLAGAHVPRFIANGDFARQPFIVMEWIEGRSLLDVMAAGRLPPTEVARLGHAVATALADLHRQNVVHLDVKPANVILRPDGRVVLVDFGLAHHLDLPDLLQEEFRIPMGTGPYISPEQVLKQRDEPRSDLFALGVMLYEMVTGRQPFGDPAGSRALRRRLWADPPRPRALVPECPEWLQEIILRAMEVDPRDRQPSARHLAFELAHPEQVEITRRGKSLRRRSFWWRTRRWLRAAGAERPRAPGEASAPTREAPIIVAAVDLSEDFTEVAAAVRTMARRMLEADPSARLACLNVLKTKRIGIDDLVDADGRAKHVNRLVALRHWAEPLKLGLDRVTFHVLESPDPADAILTYARDNHVDQIVMGARAHSSTRRYLGSVSAQVAAEAACTVTVVRTAAAAATADQPEAAA